MCDDRDTWGWVQGIPLISFINPLKSNTFRITFLLENKFCNLCFQRQLITENKINTRDTRQPHHWIHLRYVAVSFMTSTYCTWDSVRFDTKDLFGNPLALNILRKGWEIESWPNMAGLVQLLWDVPWCEAVTLKTFDGGRGGGEGGGSSLCQHQGWTPGRTLVIRPANRNFIYHRNKLRPSCLPIWHLQHNS